jgi:hypothetical protein
MREPSEQTDEEFWAENDPYGDRFAKRLPWWGCLIAATAAVLTGYLLFVR